jgi:hypothetical protein
MMNTTSPEFLTFIGYLDFPITTSNLAYLTDLFVNFTQFPIQTGVSIAEKFIKWKTFYDRSSLQLQIPPQEDTYQLSPIQDDAYSLLNSKNTTASNRRFTTTKTATNTTTATANANN